MVVRGEGQATVGPLLLDDWIAPAGALVEVAEQEGPGLRSVRPPQLLAVGSVLGQETQHIADPGELDRIPQRPGGPA